MKFCKFIHTCINSILYCCELSNLYCADLFDWPFHLTGLSHLIHLSFLGSRMSGNYIPFLRMPCSFSSRGHTHQLFPFASLPTLKAFQQKHLTTSYHQFLLSGVLYYLLHFHNSFLLNILLLCFFAELHLSDFSLKTTNNCQFLKQ